MTQQEFDERKRDAMIVCPGGSIQFFDNNGNSISVDVWLYYEGIDELEHRFNNGLSVERFKRPLSCIQSERRFK